MVERKSLPNRRLAETFNLAFGGLEGGYAVTLGYYDDGTLGEVFITGGKSGQVVEAIARDAAVILSMALQYGVPVETIRHAITRDSRGEPSSVIGAVVDCLKGVPDGPTPA